MKLQWTDFLKTAGADHPWYATGYIFLTLIIGVELVIGPWLLVKLAALIFQKRYKTCILVVCAMCTFFLLVNVLDTVVSNKVQQVLLATTQKAVVKYVNQPNNDIDDNQRGTWTYNTVDYAWQINQFLDCLRMYYIRSTIFLLGSNIIMWDKTDAWSNILLLTQTAVVAVFPWFIFNQQNYEERALVNRYNDDVFDFLDDTFQNRKTVVVHDMVGPVLTTLNSKTAGFFSKQDKLTGRLTLQLTLPTGLVAIAAFVSLIVRKIRKSRMASTLDVTKYLIIAFQRIYHLGVLLQLFIPMLYQYTCLLNLEHKLVKSTTVSSPISTTVSSPISTHIPVAMELTHAGVWFHDVSFSYENTTILTSCNYHFPLNTRTALVGPSGTGKTTILNLIQGLQAPTKGRITLNGQDLRDQTRGVGYVMQQPQIFNTTVWENVGYGMPDLDREAIEVRLKNQNLVQFLEHVGLDLGSAVGKNGDKLSGGQKQIVQLLRVLLLEPEVLLLDEPTAALDEQRAARVMELICATTLARIVIMVTHDPTTLKYMHRVIDAATGLCSDYSKETFME